MERRIIPHKKLMETEHKFDSELFYDLTVDEIGKTISNLNEQGRTHEILESADRFAAAFFEKLKKENNGKVNAEQAKEISDKLLQMSRDLTKASGQSQLDYRYRTDYLIKSAVLEKIRQIFNEAVKISLKNRT